MRGGSAGSGEPQPNPAAALRAHRPDMRLKSVLFRQRGPVVGDRHRQKMELDVRIADARARADEAARLEMVRCAKPAPAHEPLQPDQPSREQPRMAVERDRLLRGHLEIELEMVLQVLADSRPVGDDVDPERSELRRRSDARQLQELRRIDRAAAQDHLPPRPNKMIAPSAAVMDAERRGVPRRRFGSRAHA